MINETYGERLESIKERERWGSLNRVDFIWLIKQAEHIQYLETVASRRCAGRYSSLSISNRIEQLLKDRENEIKNLRKALSIYADTSNYEPFSEEDDNRSDAFNFIDLDGGEVAQHALKGDLDK